MRIETPSNMNKQEIENNLIIAKNLLAARPTDSEVRKTIQYLMGLKVKERVKSTIFQEAEDHRMQYCCPQCGSDNYRDGVCGYCIPE